MKLAVLVLVISLFLISCSESARVLSAEEQYSALDAKYSQSVGARYEECRMGDQTLIVVSGNGGTSGELHYYDSSGKKVGEYYWDDVRVPGEPEPPFSFDAQTCVVLRRSSR